MKERYRTLSAVYLMPSRMGKNGQEEIRWFGINDLPENLVVNIKEAMKNYRNNIHYSEYGWED